MKARLMTGEVVQLTKDCDCTHHEGPHWVYVDICWHRENSRLHAISNNPSLSVERRLQAAQKCFVQNHARLHTLLAEFAARNIDELMGDDAGSGE